MTRMLEPQDPGWRVAGLPLLVFAISLSLTAMLWWSVSDYVDRVEKARFTRYSERVVNELTGRLDDLQRLLKAGRGLFDASATVSHDQWAAFARSIDYDSYHGMIGVGFIERVPRTRLADFVRQVRQDTQLPFSVRQLNSDRSYPDLYVIRFIEPLAINAPARGLDVGSEPYRREAADMAMLSGEVTLTRHITLVQDQKKIAGFLLYAPVYRSKSIPDSEAARRRELLGWTYMPVRIAELMEGVSERVEHMVDFEAYEGEDPPTKESLLFDEDGHLQTPQQTDRQSYRSRSFHRTKTIRVYSQTWTMHFSTRPEFDASANWRLPRMVAIGGVAMSILLTMLVWSLARTRMHALNLAENMTRSLRESEAGLSAIVESAMDGIISIHGDGRIERFNPAAERMFGYAESEVRHRNVNILMPEPERGAHDDFLARFAATGQRRMVGTLRAVSGQRRDGETFPMELSLSEVTVNGKTMFTAIVRDITERKRVERMKSEFVSTVSHELRTPLTSIRGSLGLIVGGAVGTVSAQVQSLLEIAYSNAERLVRLINDILDSEKIESGKLVFQPVLQPLQPLMQQALTTLAGYAEQHQVRLELLPLAEDVKVNVDTDRFMQVMSNLLSNAIKYSPPREVVTVRLTERVGGVLIEVIDRGLGVPEEFTGRIFQKFSQADSSDTRAKGGTGLGLSIAKALVERMGGHIGYQTTPGKGTTFFFDLPVLGGAHAVASQTRGKLARVLYVEDDRDLSLVVQTIARDVADFDMAETLAQARKKLAERAYDLVMIDVTLPDGTAWELLPLVKSLEPAPPVMVFSAHDVDEQHAREVAAVLVKSQTSNDVLLGIIESLLARRQAA